MRNNDTLAKSILDEIGKKGQVKRKVYQRRLPENPSLDYYFIQRLTGKTEPILLEYGFIDNARDANKLKNNLLDYVEGAVKAITEYAGYTYKPVGSEEIVDNYYIVKKGDTLYSIANKFNTSVDRIKELNNLTSNTLSIGQKLLINEVDQDTTIYIVQRGDTLYGIAKKFNTNVDRLKELNNLTSNTLSIGQELIVVDANNDDVNDTNIYVVEKGDSLYSIARKYNTTVSELQLLNNLTSNILYVGQELKLPSSDNLVIDMPITDTYKVVLGDSLWSIANTYNTTVDNLISLNNLTSNILSVGQELIVPSDSNRGSNNDVRYIVKKGDNLWLIARKNNTTVDNLINYNNLKTINIKPGDVIRIPNVEHIEYTVKESDTLFSIASSNNLTVEELKTLNNLTANAVIIGQTLIIS